MADGKKSQRSVYFDLVRGLSAQMVLIGHAANIFFPLYFMKHTSGGRFLANDTRFYMQSLGVCIFFALSGYLVTKSAIIRGKKEGYRLKAFLLDRACRIFLPFWSALAFVALLDWRFARAAGANPYLADVQHGAYVFLMNAVMLFNHPVVNGIARISHLSLQATVYGSAAPFWTVVIEWWIYVSFGLIALRHDRMSWRGWLLLAFAVSVPLQQLTLGSGLVLAWIVGMAMAYASQSVAKLSRSLLWVLFILCIASAVFTAGRNGWNLYQPTVVLGIAIATILGRYLFEASGGQSARLPRLYFAFSAAAAGLSEYSYSLYLVHFSVLMYFFSYFSTPTHPWRNLFFAFFVCNLIAIGFWYLFERHYKYVRKMVHRSLHISGGDDLMPKPFAGGRRRGR